MANESEKAAEVILQEIDKQLDNFIDEVFAISQQKLVDSGKIDTGTLLKTANVNRQFLDKEIVYPALYADTIHYGRHPGSMPPVDALIPWVRRKLGEKDDAMARKIAFAIAVEIKKRGFQPFPWLEDSAEEVNSEWKFKTIKVTT